MTDVTALTSACRWITHRERGDVAGAATALCTARGRALTCRSGLGDTSAQGGLRGGSSLRPATCCPPTPAGHSDERIPRKLKLKSETKEYN